MANKTSYQYDGTVRLPKYVLVLELIRKNKYYIKTKYGQFIIIGLIKR